MRPQMIAFESTTYVLNVAAEDIDRVQAEREANPRPIAEIPGRLEMVSVMALSRTDHCYASCEITRDGRNPPSFGEFDIIRPDRSEGAIWEPLQRGMQG
jgi:hypothetical protein